MVLCIVSKNKVYPRFFGGGGAARDTPLLAKCPGLRSETSLVIHEKSRLFSTMKMQENGSVLQKYNFRQKSPCAILP